MEGEIRRVTANGHECVIYLPERCAARGIRCPALYLNGADRIEEIAALIEPAFGAMCKPFLIVSVCPQSWSDDYSPWPAPALHPGDGPFGGRASASLHALVCDVKPYIDALCLTRPEPENSALAGYSLGGLMSLYALYNTGAFGRLGSLSGSLWFDGWVDYMSSHMPVNTGAKVYLSLGVKEKHSRNQRMAKVENCTRKAAEILSAQLDSRDRLKLEWNGGGHFDGIPDRFARAMLWLMRDDATYSNFKKNGK